MGYDFLSDVKDEVARARGMYPDFNSAHEGFAIILEEVDELKAEVWKRTHDKEAMLKECLHIAAMAMRFAEEICQPN